MCSIEHIWFRAFGTLPKSNLVAGLQIRLEHYNNHGTWKLGSWHLNLTCGKEWKIRKKSKRFNTSCGGFNKNHRSSLTRAMTKNIPEFFLIYFFVGV